MPSPAYYHLHRERYIEQANVRGDGARRRIREFKAQPCSDCGVEYPYYVMDMDHREPRASAPRPSQMLTYARARLEAELAKCVVRCANCHRLRHAGAPRGEARA